jgi:hypothetical protein
MNTQDTMNNENHHILHFNNYGHTALTLASSEIPGHPGWYVLGMALAHKNDNGSRFVGKCYATESLLDGLADFHLETHIKELSKKFFGVYYVPPVVGQSGHYIVAGLENVKKLVTFLRYTDRCHSFSKKNSTYHRVFFDLPQLWERHIKSFHKFW